MTYPISEVLVDAVLRALAADAGVLVAAERRDLGREDALVDRDDAGLERLGNAEHPADVAGVEVGGEAVLGLVGEPDHLVLVLELEKGATGPKKVSSWLISMSGVQSAGTVGS